MRTLLLMRHAKSDRGDPAQADHDRPLAPRGRKAAPRMAVWLEEMELVPGQIVSSTAVRALETARLVSSELDLPAPEARRDLYMPSVDDMKEAVAMAHATRVLMVSHNPSCEDLIHSITGAWESMPTAAIAVIRFEIEVWSDILLGPTGVLEAVQRPRDLT